MARLNPIKLNSIKPTKVRQEIPDTSTPGLYLVVQPSGKRSWAFRYRYGGKPRKLTLGRCIVLSKGEAEPEPVLDGGLSLVGARKLARAMMADVDAGRDPAADKKAAKVAPPETDSNTFAANVEDYLRITVVGSDPANPKQRQGNKVARDMRRELVSRWGERCLDDIKRRDVIAMVEDIAARGAPGMARNVLGHTKAFFQWCMDRDRCENSPAATVKPKNLLGKKPTRTHILSDLDIFAYWRATGRIGYPFGPMYRFLLLTGTRIEETARARWGEMHPDLVRLIRQSNGPIDWASVPNDIKRWTVAGERFKSEANHLVPLSNAACAVLETAPHFAKGDFVFTTTEGERPVSGYGKVKRDRLDPSMRRVLRALARKQGDEARDLEHWTNHDTRRTIKTGMAAMRIDDHVTEKCIGHGPKGIQRIYDQHRYVDEMHEAFEAWAGRVRDIVNPPPPNVVRMHGDAANNHGG